MTIREYLQQKLKAFGQISEAEYAEVSAGGLNIDSEYSSDNAADTGVALCGLICEHVLSPNVSNINESGFSISWNYDNLGHYYIWLCRKYGVLVNNEVLSMLGVSAIIDVSDCW